MVCSDRAGPVIVAAPGGGAVRCVRVSTIVPVSTDQFLPLAFRGDLLGGAPVLAPAGVALSRGAMGAAGPLDGSERSGTVCSRGT